MNIVYHRNCLDGVFSSFVLYLLGRVIDEHTLDLFIARMLELRQKGISNLLDEVLGTSAQQQQEPGKRQGQGQGQQQQGRVSIDEEFFHSTRGVQTGAFSFFAGEYYPLNFPGRKKLLFIVDTNLVSAQNIANVCKTHDLVIMIDHHTSFLDIQKELLSLNLKNFLYFFDQRYCASKLALLFAHHFFLIKQQIQKPFMTRFEEEIVYVSANDLKQHQSRQSKSFVLGWYYFGIEMSHTNPNLYKRVGLLDLEYLLGRGKNLYQSHLQEIREEVAHGKVCQFLMAGPFKHKQCFYLEPRNPSKISDIGTVLSFLAAREGLLNLAVMALKRPTELRVSCRSHKSQPEPQALVLAKMFKGGGHTEAAGFKSTPNQLRTQVKILSQSTVKTNFKLTFEQLQTIFFGRPQQVVSPMQEKQ